MPLNACIAFIDFFSFGGLALHCLQVNVEAMAAARSAGERKKREMNRLSGTPAMSSSPSASSYVAHAQCDVFIFPTPLLTLLLCFFLFAGTVELLLNACNTSMLS